MKGILRVTRTDSEFLQLADIEPSYQELFRVLDRTQRSAFSLVVDLRNSPGRTDPKFEEAMRVVRPQLFRGFRRCGIMVRSASGVRQVSQHTKEDGYSVLVGNRETDILLYVSEGKFDRLD
jgi:hypothetical protein